MKLLVFVLSETERLDAILTAFAAANISGATVLESVGMARFLSRKHDEDEIPILGSLRTFLNPDIVAQGNVIFMVIEDEQVSEAVNAIESSVCDLNEKDSGIVFTIPVDFTKGICYIGK